MNPTTAQLFPPTSGIQSLISEIPNALSVKALSKNPQPQITSPTSLLALLGGGGSQGAMNGSEDSGSGLARGSIPCIKRMDRGREEEGKGEGMQDRNGGKRERRGAPALRGLTQPPRDRHPLNSLHCKPKQSTSPSYLSVTGHTCDLDVDEWRTHKMQRVSNRHTGVSGLSQPLNTPVQETDALGQEDQGARCGESHPSSYPLPLH